MNGSCREEHTGNRIFLLILAVFVLVAGYALLAMAAPVAPSGITFSGNTTANFANSNFSVNWTAPTNENISNYTVYVINSGGAVISVAWNTSATGYYFNQSSNNGNYTFNISATNTTGSAGQNATSAWIFVDIQNATIALNSPLNGNITQNSTAIFNFTAIDNGASALNCSLKLDGAVNSTNASVLNSTATIFSVPGLAAGTHLWNISCTDMALNANTSETRTLYANLNDPAITLNSPSDTAWQTPDQNVTFNYTASDDIGLRNCSIYLTNASNAGFSLNQTNSSALINGSWSNFTLNLSASGESNYTWNILCFDTGNRSAWAASNRTFFVGKRPDLNIVSMILSPTNPIVNNNITFIVTLNNSGTANTSQPVNVSFSWDGGAYVNSTLTPVNMIIGNLTNVTFVVPNTSVSVSRPYVAVVTLDPLNNISETNKSNNALSRTILTGLNVTIINITPQKPSQGQQVLVNLSVSYFNGSPVTALSWQNITALDYYIPGSKTTSVSNSTAFNTTNSASGNYWFNITAPQRNATLRADAGNHTLRLFVADNSSGQYYDNAWAVDSIQNATAISGTTKYFELQAPNLEVSLVGLVSSIDMASSRSDPFDIQLKNNGTTNISGINVTIYSNLSGSLYYNSTYSTGIVCNYTANITPSSTVTVCSPVFNVSVIGSYAVFAIGGGVDANNTQYNSTLASQTVTVTNSTTVSNSSAASSSSGSGVASASARTYTYLLNITKYNSTVSIEQGKSSMLTFTVKNTGNGTVNNISFSMSLPTGLNWNNWSTAPPVISNLIPFETASVATNLTVPANATISTYTITAKFSGAESGATNASTFTLQVLPGASEKSSINASLDGFEAQISKLNVTLASFGGTDNQNIAVARNKLAKAASLLKDAEQATIKGDYLSAYNAKAELETLLSEIREIVNEESAASEKQSTRTTRIIIVTAVLLAVASIGYYAWMPEEGYTPGKGFNFRAKDASFLEELKEKITNATSSLAISPKDAIGRVSENKAKSKLLKAPQQAFSYIPPATGVAGKLKKMHSNLKEQLTEYKKEDKKPVYNFQKKKKWDAIS